MKEFKVAAESAAKELLGGDVTIEFGVGGKVLEIQPPGTGQFAYLMAMQADSVDPTEQVAAIFDFLSRLMTEDDYRYLRNLLRDGSMTLTGFMEIIEWLVEQWSQVPTTPAPASSPRRRSSGATSTGRQHSKV